MDKPSTPKSNQYTALHMEDNLIPNKAIEARLTSGTHRCFPYFSWFLIVITIFSELYLVFFSGSTNSDAISIVVNSVFLIIWNAIVIILLWSGIKAYKNRNANRIKNLRLPWAVVTIIYLFWAFSSPIYLLHTLCGLYLLKETNDLQNLMFEQLKYELYFGNTQV